MVKERERERSRRMTSSHNSIICVINFNHSYQQVQDLKNGILQRFRLEVGGHQEDPVFQESFS